MFGRGWVIAMAGGASVLSACASTESSAPNIEPSPEASIDAALDVSAEGSTDAGKDTATPDVADAASENDAAIEADACVPEQPYDASDGPCTKGTVEKQWCGSCGHKQRFCGNDGQWKPWSDCLEDELSVCGQCETSKVSCGYCGKREVTCETGETTCRWVLGACKQSGECAAGDYELEPTGCSSGQAHVRRCSDSCAWSAAGPCETEPGWDPMPQAPIGARQNVASVVMGPKWFLWGGLAESGPLDDGATFDSSTEAWKLIPPASWPDAEGGVASLSPRSQVAVAWTGDEVVIFGGIGAGDAVLGDGARWSESAGWSGLPANGAPARRAGATATWAEKAGLVIVWGGRSAYGGAASGGGRYEPSSNTWSAISAAPIGARQGHVAMWDPTHGKMIVWGGAGDATSPPERSGAAYDPATDSWTAISDAPIRRRNAFAFWDSAADRMIVLMGEDGAWPGPKGDGAAYDPSTDSWSLLPDLALTGYLPGWGEAAALGDGHVWVTGGDVAWATGMTGLGAQYGVAHDSWGRMPALADARSGHATAWLGALLVWGGRGASGLLASGVRLRGSSLWP